MIDFEPDDEQRLVVDTVRQFARNEIRPRAREAAETGRLPGETIAAAHPLGLVANGLAAEYGGAGERSAITGALIAEELAWGDLSLALAILSPTLVAIPVADFGTDEQKRALLPPLAGEHFVPGSLAAVEPDFRSDAFRPRTRARREADAFVLSGAKCFVPWQDGGDVVLVSAAIGRDAELFLVPRDAEGLHESRERNMGIDAFPTVELELRDVRLPATARLGGDAGVDFPQIVNRGRVGLAAMAVGVARAAYEVARDWAKEREAFGAPIATKQAIAFKLADMAIEIDATRLLVWEAAWNLDRGNDATRETTLAWQQAAKIALDVADGAVQVLGGHGYIRDYLPEMHLRNARGFANFEMLTLV